MHLNDSQSSGCEDNGRKKFVSRPLTRLSQRNRTYLLNTNLSSEPNCESDSEGFLASRAIEKLTINESKRSIESDYGAPSTAALPKKILRRRRKSKRVVSMQIDMENCTLKSYTQKRGLGKRKRQTPGGILKRKIPASRDEQQDQSMMVSDADSMESGMSGKTTETYYSQDDAGQEGDNEESDWPRENTECTTNGYYNSKLFRSHQKYRGSIIPDTGQGDQKDLRTKDDFMLHPSMYSKEIYANRNIKTGNRRLVQSKHGAIDSCYLTNENRKFDNSIGEISNQSTSPNFNNNSNDPNYQKSKRYSSKRLRCGSASFISSFTESDSKFEFLPITNHHNCKVDDEDRDVILPSKYGNFNNVQTHNYNHPHRHQQYRQLHIVPSSSSPPSFNISRQSSSNRTLNNNNHNKQINSNQHGNRERILLNKSASNRFVFHHH